MPGIASRYRLRLHRDGKSAAADEFSRSYQRCGPNELPRFAPPGQSSSMDMARFEIRTGIFR